MVKIERTPTPPASLAIEKAKASGKYNLDDVVTQLHADFHGKCYLCEQNELQSIEVEHLIPHHGDVDLKFDWNNLFYSCSHCNSVKNRAQYEHDILDCCAVEPEAKLRHTLNGDKVEVTALPGADDAKNTASLIQDCFELRNHAIRSLQSQNKVKELKKTMNRLYKQLDKLDGGNGGNTMRVLRGMLSREYKFAGFTRTYVRDHLDKYPDLAQYVN